MSKFTPIQLPLAIDSLTVEIPLTRGQVTVVDAIDADLAQYSWRAQFNPGYANGGKFTAKRTDGILLHRIILSRMISRELSYDEKVDHINHDPLDNRRSNLRLATNSQNLFNRPMRKGNTSGYKGVTFHRSTGKWRARVGYKNKQIYLGLFNTPEEAYKAYCNKAIELFGDFAYLED